MTAGRTNLVLAAAVFALILALAGALAAQDEVPTVGMAPVETYQAEDLARAADALEALAERPLTPVQRQTVADTSRILDDLAAGDAVLVPSSTTAPSTTRPPATVPSTTAVPPPTITTRSADWWRDQHLADLVTTTVSP